MTTPAPDSSLWEPRGRYHLMLSRPMFPEGVISIILLLSIAACAGLSVQQADWSRIVLPVPLVAVLAGAFGSVLAKIRVLDSIAHLASILVGTALSFSLVAIQATELESNTGGRIRPLGNLVLDWYLGRGTIDGDETYLVSILVGIIVWLVGYLSAWTLFRRGWILVSLLLPGFLILVNLGYAPEPDTRYLLVYGFLCISLAARFHLYVREREWSRLRLVGPRTLPTRFLLIGVVIATLASTIGWQSPASLSQATFQPLAGEVSTRFLEAQDSAAEWVRSRADSTAIRGGNAGSYSSFDGAFSVGGPLELSDQPQAVVFADDAPYLAAQRYDTYTGRGWVSTSDDTFDDPVTDGREKAPVMTFRPGQNVPLSSDVVQRRTPTTVIVTPLGPTDDRLLTVDAFLTMNLDTSVRMAWRQLDDVPYPLRSGEPPALPVDLVPIASLLESADLRGAPGEWGPSAIDPATQAEIEKERRALISRFLTIHWTAGETGAADTLYVSGYVPVYDDVDAVFGRSTVASGTPYRVTGSSSVASRQELERAGTDYPEWIGSRYLALPESVTPRTIELASELTTSASNPLDKARIVEQYLRTAIVYDEKVIEPPSDVDLVDYVLFERQRGYCEYYASAMAVMLRSAGVPARVVVGFYPGQYDQEEGGFLYRQKNAHAWVEVFFPGFGWISFEPTASRPLLAEGSTQPDNEVVPTPTPTSSDIPTAERSTPVVSPSESNPPLPGIDALDTHHRSRWFFPSVAAISILISLGGIGWITWILPLRGKSLSSSLFLRLRRLGRFIGVPSSPTSTPREYGEAFSNALPGSRQHVDRIVLVYELDQFGPDRADDGLVYGAREAWRSIRQQLPVWILGLRRRR